LRTLEIFHPYDDWVFTLLSKFKSPHIQEIVLSAILEEGNENEIHEAVDFQSLEKVLDLRQFSHLRRVDFIFADFSKTLTDEEVDRVVQGQMPMSSRAGIVNGRSWFF
jgi:hypothetical protein